MPEIEGLQPPLLAGGERDEEPEFGQLGRGELGVEVVPERVVGEIGVPDDRIGVPQGGLLPFAVPR